ncbi:MAG: hypothetical protein ACKVQA_17115 [Burkholderiales bacterium]
MNTRGNWRLSGNVLAGLVLLCIFNSTGWTQQDAKKTSREREALRRLQAEQQQLSSKVQTLESEKAKLAGDTAAKEKELGGLKSQLKKKEAAESKLRNELKTRIAQVRADLDKVEARYNEVSGQLKDMTQTNRNNEAVIKARDGQIADLNAKLGAQREVIARQTQLLSAADEKNKALVKIGRELMGRYKDKGVMDALMQKEPFTQIERVRLQNTLQEYDEKLESHRIAMPDLGG